MVLEILERVIKRKKEAGPQLSEQKPPSEVFVEIGEARKKGSPVLADYQIDWNLVAIGVTPKHLEKLEPTIRALAKFMEPHNLGILLLVAEKNRQIQDLPENVRVVVSGEFTANWLRDCYFPTVDGLIEQPSRKLSSKFTPFILNYASGLNIESYRKISFLRGGEAMAGGNDVFVGGVLWSLLVNELGIEKTQEFLKNFFKRERVVAVPWDLIHEEDIPIPCRDLDSYLTVLGEKIILVGKEIDSRRCPKTYGFLELTTRMLAEGNSFNIYRLPFDARHQRTYNNSLIHGPKKLAFIPQYEKTDELFLRAAKVYQQVGYQPFPIPFLTSFSQREFGQIRCLTLPLPPSCPER